MNLHPFIRSMIVSGSALWVLGCGGTGAVTPASGGPAQQPDSGVRDTSPTYTPGQPITVAVSVVPDNTSVAYAMEDAPPAGWAVTNISDGGIFDAATGKVKWGIFFNQCPTFFTYTLTPSEGALGDQVFAGTLSIDGQDFPLTGQSRISHS